jgi:hypothetical protein
MDEWRRAVTAGPILEGTRQLHHNFASDPRGPVDSRSCGAEPVTPSHDVPWSGA